MSNLQVDQTSRNMRFSVTVTLSLVFLHFSSFSFDFVTDSLDVDSCKCATRIRCDI